MKLLRPGMSSPDVLVVRAILKSQGYTVLRMANPERYDKELADVVFNFQAAHKDSAGEWLKPDRVVGEKTWWALQNPSGKAQGSEKAAKGIRAIKAPSAARVAMIEAALYYLKAPTKESPDGSNWGGKVSEILRNAGGPRFWCCHFTSEIFRQATGAYPYGVDHGHVKTFWNEARRRKDAQPIGNGYVPRPGDLGVILYPKGNAGHIFLAAAIEPGTALGYRFEAIGGNEGNAVRLSIRNTWAKYFAGFVNLFGDAAEPYKPEGLYLGAITAGETGQAGTR